MLDACAVKIAHEVLDLTNKLDLRDETDFNFFKKLFGKDVTVRTGAFRAAIMFPAFIVKVPHLSTQMDILVAEKDMVAEFRFLAKALKNPLLEPFFPQTHLIRHPRSGGVALLQEKIQYVGYGVPPRGRECRKFWTSFDEALGISMDMHDYNFGWRTVGKEYVPVYVDVEILDY